MEKSKVMVCVTQQKTCERLILEGHKLIKSEEDKLYVIHVVNERENFLEYANDGEALEYLFNVSKKVGADLTVLRSKDVLKAIIDFAKSNHITHIVMGTPQNKGLGEKVGIGLQLQNNLPDVKFITL
ncbi:MAG: universal stress protein [Tissierellia bacterium]|nr:universal stress protein [Tissierellia bacterium]